MVGTHYLVDIAAADPKFLDDEEFLRNLLESAARYAGATVLQTHSHKFDPQGVTAFCLLAESHISIHTWPEDGRCAVDMFTCGDCDCHAGIELMAWGLGGVITANTMAFRCQGMPIPDLVSTDTVDEL